MMTINPTLAPRSSPALGLSVTVGVHALLAVLLLVRFHPDLPTILPEPVPVKLMQEAPSPKIEVKPVVMPSAVIHQPTPPALVVPLVKVAETPRVELPRIERPNAITVPAPQPPAAPPSPSTDKELDFQSRLMAHLNSLKRYPAEARRQGKMGVVMVRFRIDRAGHMLAYRIEQGSGHTVLDEETAHLMLRADPFPAPPDSVPGAELEFVVPVQYKLG